MTMKNVIGALFLLCLFTSSIVLAGDCAIPGESIHWIADYCLYEAETDDFLNDRVTACVDQQANEGLSDCEIKKKYKKKICQKLQSHFDDSWENCYADESFSGPTVRNGGI